MIGRSINIWFTLCLCQSKACAILAHYAEKYDYVLLFFSPFQVTKNASHCSWKDGSKHRFYCPVIGQIEYFYFQQLLYLYPKNMDWNVPCARGKDILPICQISLPKSASLFAFNL